MKRIGRIVKGAGMWVEYLLDKLFSEPWNERICWAILGIAGAWLCFVLGALAVRVVIN